ncbi:MAG: type II toxin-antitoxin system RelE/ParE family toxin [Candidatus Hydrogenedentes bacterium]|nr:type II toxin-antitoxin system RelE/ParE family toxin [Candidatus Hydrogenedentota bacterium]
MPEEPRKLLVNFFATDTGDEPVRAWLQGLDSKSRWRIGKDIQKVQYGWPIGFPVCRPLGDGLLEVRSDLRDGRTARVLFMFVEETMVVLHGFIKKTQKTPPQDRALAMKRLRSVRKNS